jgi:hypothetical protein
MNEKAKLLNNEQDNLTKKNVELVQKVYAACAKRDIGSILGCT